MTRSKPAARQAAMASSRQAGSSLPEPRVAKERKYTRPPASRRRRRSAPAASGRVPSAGVPPAPASLSMAFMRMRSPSRAPPPLRRVGSMARTAMRSLSSWSIRKRRTSSSVSDDLPEPPVPVMPRTGARCRPAAWAMRSRAPASRVPVSSGGDHPGQGPVVAAEGGLHVGRLRAAAAGRSHSAIMVLTMAASPMAWPSWGEKIRATP